MGLMSLIKGSISDAGVKGKMGALMLKDTLYGLKDKLDYSSHGGAVLFGLKAPVIKTHGSTGPEAVANTIDQIYTMLDTNVVGQLVQFFEAPKGE